jgi:hypothetical protein
MAMINRWKPPYAVQKRRVFESHRSLFKATTDCRTPNSTATEERQRCRRHQPCHIISYFNGDSREGQAVFEVLDRIVAWIFGTPLAFLWTLKNLTFLVRPPIQRVFLKARFVNLAVTKDPL